MSEEEEVTGLSKNLPLSRAISSSRQNPSHGRGVWVTSSYLNPTNKSISARSRVTGFSAFLLQTQKARKMKEKFIGLSRNFRTPFCCIFSKFPDFAQTFRASGELLYRNRRIGSSRGGPPARPPARCTVPTASQSRVRWCLTCRSAPPAPRGQGAAAPSPLARNPREFSG